MGKLKLVLLVLFLLGIFGAVNAISQQSQYKEEGGFLNSMLNIFGLGYKSDSLGSRNFEYVQVKITPELSRIEKESLVASPSASPEGETQTQKDPSGGFFPASSTSMSPTPSPAAKKQSKPSPSPANTNPYLNL